MVWGRALGVGRPSPRSWVWGRHPFPGAEKASALLRGEALPGPGRAGQCSSTRQTGALLAITTSAH